MQVQWELTPVAVEAGKRLSRRLFAGSVKLMDYETVRETWLQLSFVCMCLCVLVYACTWWLLVNIQLTDVQKLCISDHISWNS